MLPFFFSAEVKEPHLKNSKKKKKKKKEASMHIHIKPTLWNVKFKVLIILFTGFSGCEVPTCKY